MNERIKEISDEMICKINTEIEMWFIRHFE